MVAYPHLNSVYFLQRIIPLKLGVRETDTRSQSRHWPIGPISAITSTHRSREPRVTDSDDANDQRRTITLVKAYPLGLLLIAVALNYFVFGINPIDVTLPSADSIGALVAAAALLVINHTWLMTTTELTRLRYGMLSTPEEWAAKGKNAADASMEGLQELERRHNCHRNTTENTVYFAFLAGILVLVSAPTLATQVWIVSFAVARLGYTYSYLAGNVSLRGLFMSLSLLPMYGMASYILVSLFV